MLFFPDLAIRCNLIYLAQENIRDANEPKCR